MSDPTEAVDSGLQDNRPPEFGSRLNGAEPCSSRSVIDRWASQDGTTTVPNSLRAPPSLFHRGNAMMNDSANHGAAPHNDARAGPVPRMIIPEILRSRSHPLPTRFIPSHVQSNEFGVNTPTAFLSNNHSGPKSNAIQFHHPHGPPTTRSLFHQNQSAEGVVAHSIQSNGLSRPQFRSGAPIQELGGNSAAGIPSNSQTRSMMHSNNGRMNPAQLNMLRHLHSKHIRAKAMASGTVGAGSNPSNIFQTPQASTQNQMLGPSDEILGCNRVDGGSVDLDELELIEPDPEGNLLILRDPGHSAAASSFEVSDTEQAEQVGHSEMASALNAIRDFLNELPRIQRHQGYLHNVMGPDDELFSPTASSESRSIQAASIDNGNVEQAGLSIANQVPGITSYLCGESTLIRALEGNQFNRGRPNDQLFSSNGCHSCEIGASSTAVTEFKRTPTESCLEPTIMGATGSVVAHDQSGKPNSLDEDLTIQPAKDLQIQANKSGPTTSSAENPNSVNENGATPKTRKRKPRQLAPARIPPILRKVNTRSANKGQCSQSGKQLVEPSQTAPPQRCVDGSTNVLTLVAANPRSVNKGQCAQSAKLVEPSQTAPPQLCVGRPTRSSDHTHGPQKWGVPD
ncbi:uncharacterized protein LOC131254873 [Magnolia sinica]|uniref:uncharacterized protein LOC131254873 n=1 Tax=Magnolia sinica TaxID=86752 RepID=UPI0026588839|nr:uncharacterized protein LOC131254873 [Magnolia sinica]